MIRYYPMQKIGEQFRAECTDVPACLGPNDPAMVCRVSHPCTAGVEAFLPLAIGGMGPDPSVPPRVYGNQGDQAAQAADDGDDEVDGFHIERKLLVEIVH